MKFASRALALLLSAITLTSCASSTPDFEPAPDNSMMAVWGDGSSQVIIGGDGGIMNGQIGGGEEDIIKPGPSGESGASDDSPPADGCTTHSFSDWFTLKNPTCGQEGERQRSCVNCGQKESQSIPMTDHSGGTPSCNAQAVCTYCGLPYGGTLSHTWTSATCVLPKHCSVCSATEGNPLGHSGGTATCEHKAVCTVCQNEYGQLKEHDYVPATCTEAKYCSECNETFGSALGHSYAGGECIRCGEKDSNKPTVGHFYSMSFPLTLIGGSGKITSATYETSGDTLYITITGEKTLSNGSLTIGWRVYGSGHDAVADGNATTPTYSKGESFTYTITVPNVITSAHRSYLVWLGLPIIE